MKKAFAMIALSVLVLHVYGQKQKVVFVCEHGAAKSVIAANFFNKLAAERGLNYEAVSRATVPDSTLNAATRAGLKADNIPQNKNPQKLVAADTVNAKRIIMFTAVPNYLKPAATMEDWSATRDIDGSYQQRKDAIIKRINALLDALEKK